VRLLVPILLRFVVVYCLFDTVNLVISHALRGAGDTRFVGLVALVLSWPLLVWPTWASAAWGWGLYTAWTAASLYIMAQAILFLWRFRRGPWRNLRVIERPCALPGVEPGGKLRPIPPADAVHSEERLIPSRQGEP
jgi:MATE family multidrug resistance protein